jgi:hypothetical protein
MLHWASPVPRSRSGGGYRPVAARVRIAVIIAANAAATISPMSLSAAAGSPARRARPARRSGVPHNPAILALTRLVVSCPDRPGIIAAVSCFQGGREHRALRPVQLRPGGRRVLPEDGIHSAVSRRARPDRSGLRRGGRRAFRHELAPLGSRRAQAHSDRRLRGGALPARPALALAASRPRGEVALVISNHEDAAPRR